jgi:hypothetical protein
MCKYNCRINRDLRMLEVKTERKTYFDRLIPNSQTFINAIYNGGMIIAGGSLHVHHRQACSDIDVYTYDLTMEMKKYLAVNNYENTIYDDENTERKNYTQRLHEALADHNEFATNRCIKGLHDVNNGKYRQIRSIALHGVYLVIKTETTRIKEIFEYYNHDGYTNIQFMILEGGQKTTKSILDFIDQVFDFDFCKLATDGKNFYNEDKLKPKYTVNLNKIMEFKINVCGIRRIGHHIKKIIGRARKYKCRGFDIEILPYTLPIVRQRRLIRDLSYFFDSPDIIDIIVGYDFTIASSIPY